METFERIYTKSMSWGKASFSKIAIVQNMILDCNANHVDFTLDFHKLGVTPTFLISLLPILAKKHNKTLTLHCNSKIYKKLSDLNPYTYNSSNDNIAQYISNYSEIPTIIFDHLNSAPINLSDQVQSAICSKIAEIYLNAFNHSKTNFIFSGKYYKTTGNICFACYDLGIGFGGAVRNFLKKDISDSDALRWALEKGNSTESTSDSKVSRGVGLSLSKDFATLNNGKISIVSGKGVYSFRNGVSKISTLKSPFKGTFFEIEITADKSHEYIFT